MRALPFMTVIVPCDAIEAKKATLVCVEDPGPVFLRLGRHPVPIITKASDPFQIGRANRLREGDDLTLVGCGVMVDHALQAAEQLAKGNIQARVLNLHTIKPIDTGALVDAAKETGAIVTAEEHSVIGGLGSAVAEVLAQTHPVPMRYVGVEDRFGTSGQPEELLKAFHLMPEDIVRAAKEVLQLKQSFPA